MSIRCRITKINLTLERLAQNMPKEIVPEFVEKLADACLDNTYKRAPMAQRLLSNESYQKCRWEHCSSYSYSILREICFSWHKTSSN